MELHTTPTQAREWAERQRLSGARLAVVPTMGALHRGHLALIEHAATLADVVTVTIFVNPLQFNQSTDFDAYPRPIDDDLAACAAAGVDAVFAPTAATMYPAGFDTHVEPGALSERLEGPMRPGHFRGVTTVVAKLFGATRPHVAVFGQKDFQQLAIITQMVADLDMGIDVVGHPTVREPDGLALSSRNVRLTPDHRRQAVAISRGLAAAVAAHATGTSDVDVLAGLARAEIASAADAKVEYVDIVDARTLEALHHVGDRDAVILAAVWFGDVRLIDNRLLDGDGRA